jgi:hypothetical protein
MAAATKSGGGFRCLSQPGRSLGTPQQTSGRWMSRLSAPRNALPPRPVVSFKPIRPLASTTAGGPKSSSSVYLVIRAQPRSLVAAHIHQGRELGAQGAYGPRPRLTGQAHGYDGRGLAILRHGTTAQPALTYRQWHPKRPLCLRISNLRCRTWHNDLTCPGRIRNLGIRSSHWVARRIAGCRGKSQSRFDFRRLY